MRRADVELACALYQIQALSAQLAAEGDDKPKKYDAPWLKNSKEVFRVGGRFASRKGDEGIAEKLGEIKEDISKQAQKAGKAIEGKTVEHLAKKIKESIPDSIPKEIADAASYAAASVNLKIIEEHLKNKANSLKNLPKHLLEVSSDRVNAAKDVMATQSGLVAEGFPPMSAEQQANLINAEYHRRRAGRAYSLNPGERDNARAFVENVRSAKAAIGMSSDIVDRVIQGIGIETDKATKIAQDFKKRASEITPKNIKQKIGEFIKDCNLEPRGDPMGEMFNYLHASASLLAAVGGLVGPEGAVALALAPIAPSIAIGAIGANLASTAASGTAMAMKLGEDNEKTAGAVAWWTVKIIQGITLIKPSVAKFKEVYPEAQKWWASAVEKKAAQSAAKATAQKAAKQMGLPRLPNKMTQEEIQATLRANFDKGWKAQKGNVATATEKAVDFAERREAKAAHEHLMRATKITRTIDVTAIPVR
jgi:hypothetical protein